MNLNQFSLNLTQMITLLIKGSIVQIVYYNFNTNKILLVLLVYDISLQKN